MADKKIKNYSSRVIFYLTSITMTTMLSYPSAIANASNSIALLGCNCHKKLVESDFKKSIVHSPFSSMPCVTCHGGNIENNSTTGQNNSQTREKIKWILKNPTPTLLQCFTIKDMKEGDPIYLKFDDSNKQPKQKRITLPPLLSLPIMKNSGMPPKISDINILSVQKEIFLSATIGWTTDNLANSALYYGLDKKLSQNVFLEDSYLTNHQITLTGLKANRFYYYAVASADINGRRSVSPIKNFSTYNRSSNAPAYSSPSSSKNKILIKSDFFRNGNNYVLQLSSSSPISVYIGTPLNKNKKDKNSSIRAKVKNHPLLNTELFSNYTVCLKCHSASSDSLSHPVNVLPPSSMIIPADYPTLPDGRITCMSCHEFHSSNNDYRLLKKSKQELCVGCHQDMI